MNKMLMIDAQDWEHHREELLRDFIDLDLPKILELLDVVINYTAPSEYGAAVEGNLNAIKQMLTKGGDKP